MWGEEKGKEEILSFYFECLLDLLLLYYVARIVVLIYVTSKKESWSNKCFSKKFISYSVIDMLKKLFVFVFDIDYIYLINYYVGIYKDIKYYKLWYKKQERRNFSKMFLCCCLLEIVQLNKLRNHFGVNLIGFLFWKAIKEINSNILIGKVLFIIQLFSSFVFIIWILNNRYNLETLEVYILYIQCRVWGLGATFFQVSHLELTFSSPDQTKWDFCRGYGEVGGGGRQKQSHLFLPIVIGPTCENRRGGEKFSSL